MSTFALRFGGKSGHVEAIASTVEWRLCACARPACGGQRALAEYVRPPFGCRIGRVEEIRLRKATKSAEHLKLVLAIIDNPRHFPSR